MFTEFVMALCIGANVSVHKPDIPFKEVSATAYCLKGRTASGQVVRDGICAGSDLYFGKTIAVYKKSGELIGYYECLDKGGTKGIKSGNVIDIWCSDYDSCKDFMELIYEDEAKGKVYIQVMEAEG